MPESRNYDAAQLSVIVGGRSLSGFADGTFVTVVRDNPMFTKSVGADGEVARAKSNDKGGTITITLMQTSQDNAFLSALAFADEVTGNSTFPIMIRDALGTYIANCADAWAEKQADAEFGKELTDRVWTIICSQLDTVGGGN